MKHIMEVWNLYRYVSWKRRYEKPISDNDEMYYYCMEALEQEGLYDSNTGVLKDWYDYLMEQDKEMRLEWVSCETEVMMETIGDGSGLSNVYLENDGDESTSETLIAVGQLYEDLALAYVALKRFCTGHW